MSSVPYHIVLFPDGNRRWAKKRGLDSLEGHKAGYDKLIDFCQWCKDRGVKAISAFGFSTENWNRTKREVSYLMRLLEKGLRENFKKYTSNPKYKEYGIRVRVIGQKERLPKSLQKVIQEVEENTKNNNKLFLNLAISYGGRWDILQAVEKIMKHNPPIKKITENLIEENLSTAGLPVPDLILRPGGEKRLSNFLLWQAAYSELYFSPKLWPDFTEKDLDEALEDFASRQRRFGT
jgi:undecaprenyl diphosphate synthase